jgi:hypothetical protein
LFHEGDQISPLFRQGAQDAQLINLSILPPWAVFPGLSKLLYQEDAPGVACLDTVMVALRGRALAGLRNSEDRRDPSIRDRGEKYKDGAD